MDFFKQALLVKITPIVAKIFEYSLFVWVTLSDYNTQNNGTPKVVHILIPRTCDSVTLYSKRDFAHVVKLNILRWEEYPE